MSYWDGTKWVADAPHNRKPASRMKRIAAATLEASLVTALTFGLIAGTAFAGKGGNSGKPGGGGGGGGSSIALDAASASPNFGEQVHFTVTTSYTYPVVSLTCSQNGTVVYGDSRPYYWPNPFEDPGIFYLSSMSWTGGAADCTASVRVSGKNRVTTVASMTFPVEP
jgi:hypothetical protein